MDQQHNVKSILSVTIVCLIQYLHGYTDAYHMPTYEQVRRMLYWLAKRSPPYYSWRKSYTTGVLQLEFKLLSLEHQHWSEKLWLLFCL